MLITSYSFSYDENKPNILVFKEIERFSYIFGFVNVILDELSKKYNIFIISTLQEKNTMFNTIKVQEQAIKRELNKICYKKVDFDNSLGDRCDYNHAKLEELVSKYFPNLKSVDYILIACANFILLNAKYQNAPNKSQYNEFFDYVGDDKEKTEETKKYSIEFAHQINHHSSPLAFIALKQCIYINMLRFIVKKYKSTIKSIDTFIIDPAMFHFFFQTLDVPYRCFYFADDKRGTRNYINFPIAQFQHTIFDYYKQTNIDNADENRKLFMFAGSIFSKSREKIWTTFLRDLYIENSVLYIPLVKERVLQMEVSDKFLDRHKDKIIQSYSEDLYNEVKNHKMRKGHILPEDLYKEIGYYKYTFVPKCISYNDSLNFRPVLYSQNNVLPLLDVNYDPAYLMIPKEIQDRIRVSNYKDIEDKVKYFEEHPDERKDILNKLKELFHLEQFHNPEYVSEIINSTWN